MIIVQEYTCHVGSSGNIHIHSKDNCLCPCCSGELKVRDSKLRKLIMQNGEVKMFRLRRLYCSRCNKLHTELPGCIAPYKHYAVEVIASELLHIGNCPAENSTARRWKRLFFAILANLKEQTITFSKRNYSLLCEKIGKCCICTPTLRFVPE